MGDQCFHGQGPAYHHGSGDVIGGCPGLYSGEDCVSLERAVVSLGHQLCWGRGGSGRTGQGQ